MSQQAGQYHLWATSRVARYGYARVSTRSQTDDSQLDALTTAGCERILTDTASGRLARRPEWDKCLDYLRAGDELVITRLSRMARSVRHLTEIAAQLDDRGIDLVVLKQGIDTTTPAGRFLFHVIGAMDEMLADLIRRNPRRPRSRPSAWPHRRTQTQTHRPPSRRRPADVCRERCRRETSLHRRRDRRNLPRLPQDHLPPPRTQCAGPAVTIGLMPHAQR